MTNVARGNDGYERIFTDYDALTEEVRDMENNSEWKRNIESKTLSVGAFEPIEADVIGMRYGIDAGTILDTGDNTRLYISDNHGTYCLRDTAINSLLETAKISGSALSRVTAYHLADILNMCLNVARGKTLMLYRDGKINACLSDSAYTVMPISELLDMTSKELTAKFGETDFKEGYNSYAVTSVLWELPDAQNELLDKYDDAVKTHNKSLYSHSFMPAVRFISSDIGVCSATAIPMFKLPNGAYFRVNNGIKVEHKGGGNRMEKYNDEIKTIFAKFADVKKTIAAMADCEIANPLHALMLICKKAGISKVYAAEAY